MPDAKRQVKERLLFWQWVVRTVVQPTPDLELHGILYLPFAGACSDTPTKEDGYMLTIRTVEAPR